MPGTELETLGDTAVNKANSVSAVTEFSLMEITGKEQIITTEHGKGYDGENIEHCVSQRRTNLASGFEEGFLVTAMLRTTGLGRVS